MNETVIEHPNEEDVILSSRPVAPAVDVLTQVPVHDPLLYPVIEMWLTGHANGYLGDPQPTPQQRVWHKMSWGCFHDLGSATDQELAGMGLAIIGDLCKAVANKTLSTQADAKLVFIRGPGAEEFLLPWPGMPDARPVPLDLVELPFDVPMFLHDEDGQFKKRIDRLDLMRRIEALWVPYVKRLYLVVGR